MSQKQISLYASDHAVLEDILREQPDYIPLVANRLGMHLSYVETRCNRLVELGLLETVTNEVVYAVTERGEAFLAGEVDASDLVDAD